ncbi:MAG: hypothetical protein ACYSUA_17015, partial [Planctomycetota bacterium]
PQWVVVEEAPGFSDRQTGVQAPKDMTAWTCGEECEARPMMQRLAWPHQKFIRQPERNHRVMPI